MGDTWVTRTIDINQYSQIACDGYIVEVIPDVSVCEYSGILIHVKSIHKTASRQYRNFIDHIESDYMRIDLRPVAVNTFDPVTVKHENSIFNVVFEVMLEPVSWKDGKMTTGLLRLSICSKKDK